MGLSRPRSTGVVEFRSVFPHRLRKTYPNRRHPRSAGALVAGGVEAGPPGWAAARGGEPREAQRRPGRRRGSVPVPALSLGPPRPASSPQVTSITWASAAPGTPSSGRLLGSMCKKVCPNPGGTKCASHRCHLSPSSHWRSGSTSCGGGAGRAGAAAAGGKRERAGTGAGTGVRRGAVRSREIRASRPGQRLAGHGQGQADQATGWPVTGPGSGGRLGGCGGRRRPRRRRGWRAGGGCGGPSGGGSRARSG